MPVINPEDFPCVCCRRNLPADDDVSELAIARRHLCLPPDDLLDQEVLEDLEKLGANAVASLGAAAFATTVMALTY